MQYHVRPLGWVILPFFTEFKKLYFILSISWPRCCLAFKAFKNDSGININVACFLSNIWVLYINTILNVLTHLIVNLHRNGRCSPVRANASPFKSGAAKNNLSSMHDVMVTSQLLTVHSFGPCLNFFVLCCAVCMCWLACVSLTRKVRTEKYCWTCFVTWESGGASHPASSQA